MFNLFIDSNTLIIIVIEQTQKSMLDNMIHVFKSQWVL